AAGGYCVPKMINYRSRPELLLFFNDLFQGLSPQFSPMEPAKDVKDEVKNDDLEEMALLARKVGLPAQVHAAGQFFDRREIVDALALLKFLINPHDNKNLITLLRSPFGFVSDQDILDVIFTKPSATSHWSVLSGLTHLRIAELKKLLALVGQCGIGQAWFEGLLRLGYFDFSEKIDVAGRREA